MRKFFGLTRSLDGVVNAEECRNFRVFLAGRVCSAGQGIQRTARTTANLRTMER